jgi:hypothetical protein
MMQCFSCKKNKNQLLPKKSDIIETITNYLCQSCIDLKHEPRWLIVLAGRSIGTDAVRDYIVKRRYAGSEITAQELIP